MQLGSLVASDAFWVQVSIPVDRLQYIVVPGFNAQEGEGSEVSVWQELGETRVERSGRVLRLYGDLDPVGRMARVSVEIEDPLGLEIPEEERGLPLLLGAYVHVDIVGRSMVEVIEIPREALHAGRYVYVFGKESRLEVREVDIAWRREKTLLVRGGLSGGDEIITSRLGSAVAGMRLRRVTEDGESKSTAAQPEEEPRGSHDDKTGTAPTPSGEPTDSKLAEVKK
jgi:hypothetical protein